MWGLLGDYSYLHSMEPNKAGHKSCHPKLVCAEVSAFVARLAADQITCYAREEFLFFL